MVEIMTHVALMQGGNRMGYRSDIPTKVSDKLFSENTLSKFLALLSYIWLTRVVRLPLAGCITLTIGAN